MENGYNDDYPLLDFMLSDDFGASDIYAEDQVVIGPDGPELAPIELPWDNEDDDDAYYDDEPDWQTQDDEEEFYIIDERTLSSCHEEWEDYC